MTSEKTKLSEIYLSRVNGEWGAILPRKYGTIIFNAGKVPFIDFVRGIMEDYPGYKLRCIKNYGIDEKILEHQLIIKKLNSYNHQE